VVSALGFLIIGGYLAIAVLPHYVDQILEKFPPERGGYVSTGLMFSLLYVMIPATKESKASYLMGAFIAGLLFCSDHDLHHNFVSQFKRIMQVIFIPNAFLFSFTMNAYLYIFIWQSGLYGYFLLHLLDFKVS